MIKKDRLIVALDVAGLKEAEKIVKTLTPLVRIFKIGKELFTTAGPEDVKMVRRHKAKVFMDLKFHDIPNTVAAACEAATRLEVFMLNVHASGGKQMLFQAVQAVHKTAAKEKIRPPLLLGVTVLTSLTDKDLKDIGVGQKIPAQVQRLARLSKDCGLDGVVASGQEIGLIRKTVPKPFLVVTPGVRPLWAAQGDQKRIITPKQAVADGADYIVVGRPITQNQDPKAAAKKILEEMA